MSTGTRQRIVVIGAGISGLSAATRLQALLPESDVLVLEAADRVGGKLHRIPFAGGWVDVGAEAMLARRPEGLAAVAAAGLQTDLVHPLTAQALLHVSGSNRAIPGRTLVGI